MFSELEPISTYSVSVYLRTEYFIVSGVQVLYIKVSQNFSVLALIFLVKSLLFSFT